MRDYERSADQLRPVRITRRFTRAPGSVLIEFGKTAVLCTASVAEEVPPWLAAAPTPRGWITAEYSMLPGSSRPRKPRERSGKTDGRTAEIQRLIGRAVRAVSDLAALGPRTIALDCDVLDADGGTRTASITGAMVALVDALGSVREFLPDPSRLPLRDTVAAVSAGVVDGQALLDLDYREDSSAEVDMNIVLTGAGRFVELQGTGEESTFDDGDLHQLLSLARKGAAELVAHQRSALGADWPFAR